MNKVCSHCRSGQFRRVNRNGFLQHRVLSRMGYFPWECILCRRRMFFRDEGRRPSTSSPSHVPTAVAAPGVGQTAPPINQQAR